MNAYSAAPLRDVAFSAVVSDAVDAGARVMTDIAKFGLPLAELHIVARPDGGAALQARLLAPAGADVEQLLSRLARHVCILSLSAP